MEDPAMHDIRIHVMIKEQESLCFQYPYPEAKWELRYSDVYNRSTPRLLASLSRFGRLQSAEDGIFFPDELLNTDTLNRSLRILSDSTESDDIPTLYHLPLFQHSKTSLIETLVTLHLPEADLLAALADVRLFHQVIFPHHIHPNKWIIFLVLLSTGKVERYFIGDFTHSEIHFASDKLFNALRQLFPWKQFVLTSRLFVPSTFVEDHALTALLMIGSLHNRDNYLDTSREMVDFFKLYTSQDIRPRHDIWLGQLSIQSITRPSHPFVEKEVKLSPPEGEPKESLPYELPDYEELLIGKGWMTFDVTGDGNCAYYSLILGLQNVGDMQYSVTANELGPPNMSENEIWQAKIVGLRRRLLSHSDYLLERMYPRKKRGHPFWIYTGASSYKSQQNLSLEFIDPGREQHKYFDRSLKEEQYMNPYWGPLVFASLFEVRVIIILRTTNTLPLDDNRYNVTVSWATVMFEYNSPTDSVEQPHILFTMHEGEAVRIPHNDFKAKPTIELVFNSGFLPPTAVDKQKHFANPKNKYLPVPNRLADQHFQFLRRILCDNIPVLPTPNNFESLRVLLEQQITLRQEDENRKISEMCRLYDEIGKSLENPVQNQPTASVFSPTMDGDHAINEEIGTSLDIPTPNATAETGDSPGLDDDQELCLDAPFNQDTDVMEDEAHEINVDVHAARDHVETTTTTAASLLSEKKNNSQKKGTRYAKKGMKTVSAKKAKSTANPTPNATAETGDSPGLDDDQELRLDAPFNQDTDVMEDEAHEINVDVHATRDHVETTTTTAASLLSEKKNNSQKKGTRYAKKGMKTVSAKKAKSTANAKTPVRSLSLKKLTELFNERFEEGRFKHNVATKLLYNPEKNTYAIKRRKEKTKKVVQQIVPPGKVQQLDSFLLKQARRNPNIWVGPSLGDPGNGNAPAHLVTKIVSTNQQHGNPYCLAYSLGSALFYCGFLGASKTISDQARCFSEMHFDCALLRLRELMPGVAPEIGRATMYGIRTKCHRKIMRVMSWETIMTELTPYPTVVIPAYPNGTKTHALCIVDDLIFDSTTPKALKLHMDSIEWIFDCKHMDIEEVLRFNVKFSPPGIKVETSYKRPVTLHWSHPSRPQPDPRQAMIHSHKNHLVHIDETTQEQHYTDRTVYNKRKTKEETTMKLN